MTTLYRAAKDDYLDQGYAFAESLETATVYLENPGFGGASLYSIEIEPTSEQVIDLTDVSVSDLAADLEMSDPGAIGVDEWLPRTVRALDALRSRGHLWAKVAESYPADTVTWIWLGTSADDEPTLEAL
jgi:hypothetical protein